jgi:hypothetical protein
VEVTFCPKCLGMYNVKPGEEVASAKCPQCGAPLFIPDTLHSIDVAGTVLVSKGGPSEPPGEKGKATSSADGVATMPGTPAPPSSPRSSRKGLPNPRHRERSAAGKGSGGLGGTASSGRSDAGAWGSCTRPLTRA